MTVKNLFQIADEKDDIFEINLDNSDLLDLTHTLSFPLTTNTYPELLSLFYHNAHTEIEKNTTFTEADIKQRRYFADTLTCYECGKTGHLSKNCPLRVRNTCILCSQKGHEKRDCPMMVCNKCYLLGHHARICPVKDNRSRYMLCKRCKSGEHSVRDCPSYWREYRVKSLDFNKPIRKSCCVCFSDKHYVDDCRKNKTKYSVFNSDFMSIVRLYKK